MLFALYSVCTVSSAWYLNNTSAQSAPVCACFPKLLPEMKNKTHKLLSWMGLCYVWLAVTVCVTGYFDVKFHPISI